VLRRLAVVAAFFALLFVAVPRVLLPAAGRALVHEESPEKADLAVVLAGDYRGNRISKGADLVRAGYVPAVLVSGPNGFYGQHESDYEVAYAIRRGFPASWFIAFPHDALSTREEATLVLAELRRRDVHRFLLVTSNFHTARATRLFRAAERAEGGGPEFRTIAAPDQYFQPDSWWHSREGSKTAFFEWTKTLTSAVGM
jgi:uncharacterized SAM-binding protein YcdF (DUF218 family)